MRGRYFRSFLQKPLLSRGVFFQELLSGGRIIIQVVFIPHPISLYLKPISLQRRFYRFTAIKLVSMSTAIIPTKYRNYSYYNLLP